MQAAMGQGGGDYGGMPKAASEDEWIYDALGWTILITGLVSLGTSADTRHT